MIISQFISFLRTYLIEYHINRRILVVLFFLCLGSSLAYATYTPFNTNSPGNIGIGSTNPGQKLDVVGTVRATAFIGNGSLLTGINSSQWLTINTNDVYLSNNGNVGIGTTFIGGIGEAALTVMNGPVGIGTWVPSRELDVKGSGNFSDIVYAPSIISNSQTNLIIGQDENDTSEITFDVASENILFDSNTGSAIFNIPVQATSITGGGVAISNLTLQSTTAVGTTDSVIFRVGNNGATQAMTISHAGNVGIGSINPSQILDVQGTIRASNFTMTGQTPISGYVLTATDTSGDTTWSTAGSVSGWTVTNTNDVYETKNGNIGIGTTFTKTAALTVMNGNL